MSKEAILSSEKEHQFPCQSCGADLKYLPGKYLPGTLKMQCHHCGMHYDVDEHKTGDVHELDFYQSIDNIKQQNLKEQIFSDINSPTDNSASAISGAGNAHQNIDTAIVTCSSCAASFPFEKNLHAGACPYCGSSIVQDLEHKSIITPWGILPFAIDSKTAFQAYKKWLSKLWFAPSKLKHYARTHEALNGMYVPYWTFDTNTSTHYSGQRGTYYQVPTQVTTRINGKTVTQTKMVTKVRWRHVSGHVGMSFDDILIYASDSLPKHIAKELEPWDLAKLRYYQPEFISGFKSEIYKLGLEAGFQETRQRITPDIQRAIQFDIGGDLQRISSMQTEHSNIKFRHILLPFWVAGFRFNNRTYQFVVNGRTGEVQGKRPYSYIKIFFAVLVALIFLIIAAGFIYGSGMLDEMFHMMNTMQVGY